MLWVLWQRKIRFQDVHGGKKVKMSLADQWAFHWNTVVFYWLVNRDPYIGLWNNPHIYNWVRFHPLYHINNQGFLSLLTCWLVNRDPYNGKLYSLYTWLDLGSMIPYMGFVASSLHLHSTWRSIPVKWLINVVILRPLTGVIFFQMAFVWLIDGGY